MTTRIQRLRVLWCLLSFATMLAAAGCGGLKLVPVSGTVMLGDQPLHGGGVCFIPDASQGNQARVSCVGRINAQGRYELSTSSVQGSESGRGAPLGWYKVTLLTTLPGSPEITVDRRYLDAETTPLRIEVVANASPGTYDLKLAK